MVAVGEDHAALHKQASALLLNAAVDSLLMLLTVLLLHHPASCYHLNSRPQKSSTPSLMMPADKLTSAKAGVTRIENNN
jgi:hypothetical protein